MKTMGTIIGIAAVGFATAGATAYAQRDPAYEAARSSGAIGEKPDGYLGFVSSPSAAVQALVQDLNIKRKQHYTRKAAEQNVTVQDFAFTTGCDLIARTGQGEMYQTPGGQWVRRGAGAPTRDPRCP